MQKFCAPVEGVGILSDGRGNRRYRGRDNERPSGKPVVQSGPRLLDLIQLPEAIRPEGIDGTSVTRLVRVRSELTVEVFPGQRQWLLEHEGSVGEPHIEIEAERRSLECPQGCSCPAEVVGG